MIFAQHIINTPAIHYDIMEITLSQIISFCEYTLTIRFKRWIFCFSDKNFDGKQSFYATVKIADSDFIHCAFRSIEE